MIDNVVLLISGTLHERDTHDLLERCHPLGVFETMPALCVATNVEELFNTVLVETPLGASVRATRARRIARPDSPPFARSTLLPRLPLGAGPRRAQHRDHPQHGAHLSLPLPSPSLAEPRPDALPHFPQLYRSYLEDFHAFVLSIGGPTVEVMSPILNFEADRRSLNITINSFGTSLSKEQRGKLLPKLGRLYPEGTMALARADDVDQVKAVIDPILEYRPFLEGQGASSSGGSGSGGGAGTGIDGAGAGGAAASLEDHFFQHEVFLNKLAFMQQFQIGVFYAFFKLKEQEIRSLTWIAECIAQNAKDRIKCVASLPLFLSPLERKSLTCRPYARSDYVPTF